MRVAKKTGEQVNEGRKKHVQVKITKNNTSESNLNLRNFCGCNCRIYIILHESCPSPSEQVGKWENEHVFAQFVFQSQINEENSWKIMAAGTFPTVTG